ADEAYLYATGHVEIALAKDPARTETRDLLADILIDRATLAEHVYDLRLRDELVKRVALYDADGSRRTRWNAPGRVIVRAPAGAAITLRADRPSISGSAAFADRALGSGSADIALSPRSYSLSVAIPDRAPV